MATPSAPADPNAQYVRCHAGDFSRGTKNLRAAAGRALNIQTTIRGTGLGFRTFRPARRKVVGPSMGAKVNVMGGCCGDTETHDLRSASLFEADPSPIHYIGFRTFRVLVSTTHRAEP